MAVVLVVQLDDVGVVDIRQKRFFAHEGLERSEINVVALHDAAL